ncbi:MAG: FAD-binding oxidoreductase [Geminicoccaceae bacterium]|nr:MAG: FAD-binding oxidoreductase [Geminicoccaceae bacterium]
MSAFALDAHAYDTSQPSGSFWHAADGIEAPGLVGATTADVAIIGGGVVGLNAALRLVESAGVDVVLLEAGEIGWGASGRNGGFCSDGATKLAPRAMRRRFGAVEAQRFFDLQLGAIDHVAHLLERLGIDAGPKKGEGEMLLAHRPLAHTDLASECQAIEAAYGRKVTLFDTDGLSGFGMAGPQFHSGVLIPIGFALDPGRYVRALARAVLSQGARLCARSRVVAIDQAGAGFRLRTKGGEVTAKRLIVATNAYTDEALVPALRGRLLPAFSNVLVTRPLTDAELADQGWTSSCMAFDSRELLHYFRLLPDRRFLFGGRGGVDGGPGGQAQAQARLRRDFHVLFPAWREVEVRHLWSGLVCLTRDLLPFVGQLDAPKGAWTALGWHGNGVAMGSKAGELVADLALGSLRLADLPAPLTQKLRRFPLPRSLLLRAAYAWFDYRDGPLKADP